MKKRTKRMLRPFELWNPGAVEQWLEDEAAKGWRLVDLDGWFVKFEAAEPKTCRVRVYPQGPESREAFQARIADYEGMGWTFAAAIGLEFEIFYCDDPSVPELFTDPLSYGLAWKKWLDRAWWEGWLMLLPVLLLAVVWVVVALQETLLQTALRMSLFLWVCTLVVAPVLAVLAVRTLCTVQRLRRRIVAGVAPERNGNWRKSRQVWKLIVVLYMLYWAAFCFRDLAVGFQEPKGLNFLPLTELGEEVDWDLAPEDFYMRRKTPLEPARLETRFVDGGGRSVHNATHHLRFEFLAKALYREKRETFLAEWPEAAETPVENAAFDQAVLLAGGEADRMLLVRSGEVVYSLCTDFPADLTTAVDSVAAYVTGD